MPQILFDIAIKIAVAVATSFGSGASAAFIAKATFFTVYTLGAIAIAAGANYAINSIVGAKLSDLNDQIKGRQQNVKSPTLYRRKIYGSVRVGGGVFYIDTAGNDNKYLYLGITLASHEVSAINDVYFWNEEVAASTWSSLYQIDKKTGTGAQTSSTVLQASARWTTNHRARGVAFLGIELKWHDKKWASGIPPITADVDGAKLYDPRLDSTNGGSGLHRLADSSTWEHSSNPALVIADYLRDNIVGPGFADGDIDWPSIATAADVCDETVGTAGGVGTENRYTLHGVVDSNEVPESVLENMLACMDGMLSFVGGKFKVFAGEWNASTTSLTEDDLRGGIQFRDAPSATDLVNTATGLFYNRDTNQPSEFPKIQNATYLAEDNNRELGQAMNFFFTDSVSEAQRLALIRINKSRRGTSLVLPCKLTAANIAVNDVIDLTIGYLGWTNKTFRVVGYTLNLAAGGVDLMLIAEDSSIWTWAAGSYTNPTAGSGTVWPDPYASIPAPTVGTWSSSTEQSTNKDSKSYGLFEITPPDNAIVEGFEVEYRLNGSTSWTPHGFVKNNLDVDSITTPISVQIDGLVMGAYYDVRARSVAYATGEYSTWATMTNQQVQIKDEYYQKIVAVQDATFRKTWNLGVLLWGNDYWWNRSHGDTITLSETYGENYSVGVYDDPAVRMGGDASQNRTLAQRPRFACKIGDKFGFSARVKLDATFFSNYDGVTDAFRVELVEFDPDGAATQWNDFWNTGDANNGTASNTWVTISGTVEATDATTEWASLMFVVGSGSNLGYVYIDQVEIWRVGAGVDNSLVAYDELLWKPTADGGLISDPDFTLEKNGRDHWSYSASGVTLDTTAVVGAPTHAANLYAFKIDAPAATYTFVGQSVSWQPQVRKGNTIVARAIVAHDGNVTDDDDNSLKFVFVERNEAGTSLGAYTRYNARESYYPSANTWYETAEVQHEIQSADCHHVDCRFLVGAANDGNGHWWVGHYQAHLHGENADNTLNNPQNLDWLANLALYTQVNHLYARGSAYLMSPSTGEVMIDGVSRVGTTTRGLTLTVIKKSDHSAISFRHDGTGTGSLVTSYVYDIHLNDTNRGTLKDALVELRTNGNATLTAGNWGGDVIVVLVSHDSWVLDGTNGELLKAEMKLHGASPSINNADTTPNFRTPYILIGSPAIGESNGIEVWGTEDDPDSPLAEYNAIMVNGALPGLGMRGDATADADISPTQFVAGNLSVALTLIAGASIVLNAAGHFRGGQTAYDTGNGFWLGYDSAYKFSIRNGTQFLRYDGTTLEASGDIWAKEMTNDAADSVQWELATTTEKSGAAGATFTKVRSIGLKAGGACRLVVECKGSGDDPYDSGEYPAIKIEQNGSVVTGGGEVSLALVTTYTDQTFELSGLVPQYPIDIMMRGGTKSSIPKLVWIRDTTVYADDPPANSIKDWI